MTTDIELLFKIDRKLDQLLQFKDDLNAHLREDRLMFYGEDGNSGLVGDVIELKQSRRLYNRVLATLGVAVATVFGEGIWRIFK